MRACTLLFMLPLAEAFVAPVGVKVPARTRASGVVRSVNMDETGLTVQDLISQYESEQERRRLAEIEEEDRLAMLERRSAFLGGIRKFMDGQAFLAMEKVSCVLFLTLTYAAWTGAWTSNEWMTYTAEDSLKSATLAIGGAHVVLAGLSGFVTLAKQRDGVVLNTIRTLLVGGLDFWRVAVMEDKAEKTLRELAAQPPLAMEISTFQMEESTPVEGVLLSTTVRTLPGKQHQMRELLKGLAHDAIDAGPSTGLSTIAVNQDPEDRRTFVMLQRFMSKDKMQAYQSGARFKSFLQDVQPLLSEPLGLYITSEREGQLTESRYPFGPGGEGGRDDAIYSSPTNIGGTQTRYS